MRVNFFLIFFIFLPLVIFAQSSQKPKTAASSEKLKEAKLLNSDSVKNKKNDFGFGFFIETFVNNSSAIRSKTSGNTEVSALRSFGFALGYGLFFDLSKKVELRAFPGVIFQEDHIQYSTTKPFDTLVFKPSSLFLPLHLTFKPFKKEFYLIGGTSSYFDVRRGRYDPLYALSLKRFNQSLDVGLGYLLKAKKFDFVPELRYSHGILNLAGDKTTYYGTALSNYYRHRISLVFVFR